MAYAKKSTPRAKGNTREVTATKKTGMAWNRTATPLNKAFSKSKKLRVTPSKSTLYKKSEAGRIK